MVFKVPLPKQKHNKGFLYHFQPKFSLVPLEGALWLSCTDRATLILSLL